MSKLDEVLRRADPLDEVILTAQGLTPTGKLSIELQANQAGASVTMGYEFSLMLRKEGDAPEQTYELTLDAGETRLLDAANARLLTEQVCVAYVLREAIDVEGVKRLYEYTVAVQANFTVHVTHQRDDPFVRFEVRLNPVTSLVGMMPPNEASRYFVLASEVAEWQ